MISISAINFEKFYWMRYASDRATQVVVKGKTIRIEKGTLFGVREVRGSEADELILADGTKFRLEIRKSEVLMNRSKEFKGKIPVAPVKVRGNTSVENQFERWAKKLGYTVVTVEKISLSDFKTLLGQCKSDQERLALKRWVLSKLTRGSAQYQKVGQYNVVSKKEPKLVLATRHKFQVTEKLGQAKPKILHLNTKTRAKVTKLTTEVDEDNRPVNVAKIEFPDLEDFTDHDIPAEFKKFARVESSAHVNYLQCLASADELQECAASVSEDFNSIVRQTLEPHIANAKKLVDAGVKAAAAKIRAWAMTHLVQAKKLGHNTALFEKLMNNPEAAARQLAYTLMGIKADAKTKVAQEETKRMDALLDNIQLSI